MEEFYDFNYNEYLACFVSTSTYSYSIHQVVSIRKCLSEPMSSVLLLWLLPSAAFSLPLLWPTLAPAWGTHVPACRWQAISPFAPGSRLFHYPVPVANRKAKIPGPSGQVSTKVSCRWERAPLALLQILIKTWLVPELALLVLFLQGRFHQDISVTHHLLIECIMKLDGIGNNMWAEQFRTTHF